MFQSKEKKAKEEMKAAVDESNWVKLLSLGLAKIMELLCGDGPIPFQRFLKHTSDYFDHCIMDISRKKQLLYVGGKMVMELDEARADKPANILLSADFYFQTADKQWIVEKKQGHISADRFRDWETDADAVKLQESGRLEMSIEPPEAGVK